MLQVPSDIKAHSLQPAPQHAARPPQAPDRAQGSPFESLLDDATQAPASRPSPSDDNAPRAARAEPAQPADRAKDSKATKPSDDANSAPKPEAKSDVKPDAETDGESDTETDAKSVVKFEVTADTMSIDGDAKADKPETGTDATCDGKAAADAKTGDQAASIVDAKPVGDAKPADVPVPVDPAIVAAAPPVTTITPADAIATALAPVIVEQAASPADAPAIVAAAQTKSGASASLQADADKSADEPKPLIKAAVQSPTDSKPQAAASDSDKGSVAQFRGEVPVNSHRGAGAETPATAALDANVAAPKPGADMMQPAIFTAPSHATPAAATAIAAAQQLAPPAAAIPLANVAFEITNRALAGTNHFEIRLDPPELGRIEVRLDVDRDGNVTSRLIADRSETLDLLRRNANGLERALQDAGLKTTDNSLQFSLRDQSAGQQQTHGGADTARPALEDQTLAAIEPTAFDYSRLAGHGGGLDIRV